MRRYIVFAGAGILALGFAVAETGIRYNHSESMPTGFYLPSKQPTEFVAICLERKWSDLSAAYRGFGDCPDGLSPLLKRVVATAGHLVETSPEGLRVDQALIPQTAPLVIDSQGRKMVPYPFGTYVVASGFLWLASDRSPRGYDSRYFGPVQGADVRAFMRPLFPGRRTEP